MMMMMMIHFGPGRFVVHNRSCRVKRVKELSKAVLSNSPVRALRVFTFYVLEHKILNYDTKY